MNDRVELDRLADYAAGVLDGTPQAEEIAHLIATDEAWTAAYVELVDADRTVRDELAALRTVPEPMPGDVASRLDAALASVHAAGGMHRADRPQLSDRADLAGRAQLSGRPAAADRSPAGRPGSRADSRTPGSAAQARRRRRGWTLVAVAAGVLALGGIGVPVVTEALRSRDTVSGASSESDAQLGRDAATEQAPGAAAPQVRAPVLLASGTDYSAADLTALAVGNKARSPGGSTGAATDPRRWDAALVPPALSGLVDLGARSACLQRLAAMYGGFVDTVDFARFEGEPALVVVLVDAAGRPTRVVVAGPGCAQPAAGGDVRRSVPVG
ncbi:MAG TPA: hypothetical protein VFM55_13820 [Micromonosporaceae bacterium]|nr:hypothetical protein [Micromonosporaceae bacterium]